MSSSWDDDSRMTFGKYKGVAMRDVPDSYIRWLADQTWFGPDSHPGLYEYVMLAIGEKP